MHLHQPSLLVSSFHPVAQIYTIQHRSGIRWIWKKIKNWTHCIWWRLLPKTRYSKKKPYSIPSFLYIFLPRSQTSLYYFQVVLSNSSSAFLKIFQSFLWTSPAFSFIFSPVLVPDLFLNVFFCLLSRLTLTYELFKHKKNLPDLMGEPVLCLHLTDNKEPILNRIFRHFVNNDLFKDTQVAFLKSFFSCIYEKKDNADWQAWNSIFVFASQFAKRYWHISAWSAVCP